MCRDCYRAGPAELAYRQVVRDIDRALGCGQCIPRRQRKMIEGYLTYRDERVRAYAARVIARDAEARQESARLREEDELAFEAMGAMGTMMMPDEGPADATSELDPFAPDPSDDDLPF